MLKTGKKSEYAYQKQIEQNTKSEEETQKSYAILNSESSQEFCGIYERKYHKTWIFFADDGTK